MIPRSQVARKLELQDEDEEDQRERHRMEAALKLMGIERSALAMDDEPEPFWTESGAIESFSADTSSRSTRPAHADVSMPVAYSLHVGSGEQQQGLPSTTSPIRAVK